MLRECFAFCTGWLARSRLRGASQAPVLRVTSSAHGCGRRTYTSRSRLRSFNRCAARDWRPGGTGAAHRAGFASVAEILGIAPGRRRAQPDGLGAPLDQRSRLASLPLAYHRNPRSAAAEDAAAIALRSRELPHETG